MVPDDLHYVVDWYWCFTGRYSMTYEFYVPTTFHDYPKSIDQIRRICETVDGLECRIGPERPFFPFVKDDIPGDVLSIIDRRTRPTPELNRWFGSIECCNPAHGNRMYFHW